MITGPQGTGKTTVAGNLALGLAGIPGFEELFGHSVKALARGKRVLYLALDLPQQIARCLRRMAAALPEDEQEILAQRMLVQQGGDLPFDLLREPKAIASWAEQLEAGALIVDSTKDLAHELSDEKVAASVNESIQACIVADIEVLLLHHNRKANSDNKSPRKLDDVHGSGNLTRGLGSVVCLWGEPGGEEIQLLHLKQPAEVVGPLVVSHDRETGRALTCFSREPRRRARRPRRSGGARI
jgi:RecA-family ATPase